MLGSVLECVKALGVQGGPGVSCKRELQEDEAYVVSIVLMCAHIRNTCMSVVHNKGHLVLIF